MCGICAVVTDNRPVDRTLLQTMCDRMRHRGPDAEGLHVIGGVGLGMRRLSIIDLECGNQPVFNEDRSLAVVFNGEIYNYRELREQLRGRGHRFATASDTEVIVHLYEEYGADAVRRLRGMFAFAIHDLATGRVLFARDRLGIKPLYYAAVGGALYVASEIKSLLAVPEWPRALDEIALDQYFSLLYVPAPRTIFRAVKKLPPGHLLVKDRGREPVLRCYWSLPDGNGAQRSDEDWIEEFRHRFDDAVRSHLIADVPVGVFLSGGLDSSAIIAAVARSGHGRVRTFSVGFGPEYSGFDERSRAREIASRFGTTHEEVEITPDVRDVVHHLGSVFDEPLGDSGAVPNFLVCQAARQELTVALSGLGGDELAGGYERYLGVKLGEWYRRTPAWARNGLVRRLMDLIPEPRNGGRSIDRGKRFLRYGALPAVERFFAFSSPLDRQRRLDLYTPELQELVEPDSALNLMRLAARPQSSRDLVNQLLAIDMSTYLVDDLLVVADRVSMAVSLEVRVPFLDHQLVEFALDVPGSLKVRGLRKKYLMKRAFEKDLPPSVIHGRKSGFSLPIARWLREDLRDTVEDVLENGRIARYGLFRPDVVTGLKAEHFGRKRDHSGILWALLMFQLWADNYYQ